jgi:hypothetical protein
MKKLTAAAVTNAIQEKSEEARKSALFEVKSLKKDLLNLEKVLSSKKCILEDPAFDIVHGAFEVFRHTEVICQNVKLQEQIDNSLEKASFKDFLDSKGARLLKKPEGWHWISPSGEMHYLGAPNDAQTAAETLESLLSNKKAPAKKTATKKKTVKKNTEENSSETAAKASKKKADQNSDNPEAAAQA